MRAADADAQKKIATEAQLEAIAYTTHIPLGEYSVPVAMRKNIDGIIDAAAPVFWNITKK